MGPFPRGGRARFILGLLVITALSLMTLDGRGAGPVGTVRSAAMSVLSPFRSAAEWVLSPVGDVWNGIFGYGELEAENAELRRELAEMEGAELREASALAQLERIYRDLEIDFAPDIEQVAARVVAGPATAFEETVTINKGSDHGIAEGMAVVIGSGLVGRIESVSANESVVVLLTDPRMRVGGRIVSNQAQGVIEGRGEDRLPQLAVSGDVELAIGDILETTGLAASTYPPGVPIGRVVSVPEPTAPADPDEGEGEVDEDDVTATTTGGVSVLDGLDAVTTNRVDVEPSARLDRLHFLVVLLWEPSR